MRGNLSVGMRNPKREPRTTNREPRTTKIWYTVCMTDESQSVEPEEEFEEEAIIPEEDFREAIAACRRDRELDRYFKMAPSGAKLFIGLGFYSTHFGDKVDPRQYAECQAEIEPALTVNDLKYLIRFERDKNTKKYLRELLAQREAEVVPEEPAQVDVPPPESGDTPIAPPKRKVRRKLPAPTLRAEDAPAERDNSVSLPLKVAAALAFLLLGVVALYFSQRASDRPSEPTPSVAAVDPSGSGREETSNAVAHADAQQPGSDEREEEEVAPAMTDVGEEDAPPQVAETPETPPETTAAATADVPSRSRGRKPRIVLTDGKKIVRRSGGVIEVPRVFSCAGAGIKPFWVYGAHPEAEAAKEKKAREEWQALVSQAGAPSP